MEAKSNRLGWGAYAAGALLAANVVVPLVWGDLYPFTSAPMFRDMPTECANYRVYDPQGRELPAADWHCQRIYDGNPLGYGVGIQPPPVIEQEFGEVADEAAIRAHFAPLLAREEHRGLAFIDIEQDQIGAVDGQQVGVIRTTRLRIMRE